MKNLLPLKSLLSFALLVCSTNISANKIISVSDFGLKPDSRINAVPFVQKAINACKQHPGSTLVFPKGRYDFWAQHAIERDYHETNTYDVNPKILAVLLDQVNNLTIDGNGSEFIMHGRMQPFTLDRCQNITLKNFSVDWEIPLTAQGTVTQSTPDHIEVEIDTRQYPYIIENKRLTFVGEGWKSGLWSIMQITCIFFRPSSLTASRKKTHFFSTDSTNANERSSRTILSGSEGNPAPDPISATFAPAGKYVSAQILSKKCLMRHSSRPIMRVRLNFSL